MIEIPQIRDRFETQLAAGRTDRAVATISEAVDHAVDGGVPASVAPLVSRVLADVVATGHAATGAAWIERLLAELPEPQGPTDRVGVLRGRLLSAYSGLLRTQRRPSEALEAQEEAIALLGDRVTAVQRTTLDHDRSVLLADLGVLDQAVAGLVAAREAFLDARDRVGVAASCHNLAFVLHDMGALDDAVEYLNEAREIFLATGMAEEAAACDQNLGVVLYDAGRLDEAGRRFTAARKRFADNDALVGVAECEANLATVLGALGRDDVAERHRRRAELAGVGMPTVPGTSSQIPAVESGIDGAPSQSPVRSGNASA